METKETFLHLQSKKLLSDWWMERNYFNIKPSRIDVEKALSMGGFVQFIPDIIIYNVNGMKAFVEIEHKNPVDNYKLWKMVQFGMWHNFSPLVIQISAYWIMTQVNVPDVLKCDVLYKYPL